MNIAPSDYNPEIRSSDEQSGKWFDNGPRLREYLRNGMIPDDDGMVQVRSENEMTEIINEVYTNGFSSRSAFIGTNELGQWMIETVDGGEPGWSDDPAVW